MCVPGEQDGERVSVSVHHDVYVVPAAVWAGARSLRSSAAALRAPALRVMSVWSVRLPVETLREELLSAWRMLLQQGQMTQRPHITHLDVRSFAGMRVLTLVSFNEQNFLSSS